MNSVQITREGNLKLQILDCGILPSGKMAQEQKTYAAIGRRSKGDLRILMTPTVQAMIGVNRTMRVQYRALHKD
jgi:hypothetical protein